MFFGFLRFLLGFRGFPCFSLGLPGVSWSVLECSVCPVCLCFGVFRVSVFSMFSMFSVFFCFCETAHLDFYTVVTSFPSVALCLQVPILSPVTVVLVVRECVLP